MRLATCAAALFCATSAVAQTRSARSVIGCWHLEPAPFTESAKRHVDPGQTNLPTVIRFDTVPGINWNGDRVGRRVRAIAEDTITQYRDGWYLLPGADSVRVEWTGGFAGMTLDLRADGPVLRGTANAWTDYMGGAEAPIVLRRVSCPKRSTLHKK